MVQYNNHASVPSLLQRLSGIHKLSGIHYQDTPIKLDLKSIR